jgi:DNA polymerase-3 subunit beta
MPPPVAGKPSGLPAMEIAVQKSDLLKEISITQGVVERKSTVPILSSFLFEATENKLLITATDLDLSLRTFCPAKVIKAGSCTVPARKLYEYVRLLRDGEITIRLLENHWVQIRSGRSNTKMVGMPRDNFPTLPLFPAQSAIQLPAPVLQTMIARTIFAISQEESRYTLNGALLLIRPGAITMVSTDGHRLAHIETVKSKVAVTEEIRVLVPRKALAEVNALLNSSAVDTIGFAKDQTTLFFTIGARLFKARQLTGQFPNYEAVLPRDLNGSIEVPAVQLAQAVNRVAQFSDERSGAICLRIEKNLLRVTSSRPESGESEDSLKTSYGGDPLVMGFNSRYVLDFMKVAGDGNVRFHFKAPDAAGEFRTDQDSDSDCEYKYRYIVMPVRT